MENKWVLLRTYTDETIAEIDRGMLESIGIAAYLDGTNIITANHLFTNAVGGIKLFVDASQKEKALALLANH